MQRPNVGGAPQAMCCMASLIKFFKSFSVLQSLKSVIVAPRDLKCFVGAVWQKWVRFCDAWSLEEVAKAQAKRAFGRDCWCVFKGCRFLKRASASPHSLEGGRKVQQNGSTLRRCPLASERVLRHLPPTNSQSQQFCEHFFNLLLYLCSR
jgi:hypothetical protein